MRARSRFRLRTRWQASTALTRRNRQQGEIELAGRNDGHTKERYYGFSFRLDCVRRGPVGCALDRDRVGADRAGQSARALKVGAIGAVSDAGIFIAQEKGYFKDEGLDVEIVGFRAAPQILPAIATGEVQVSGSAVTPALFNAFARGITMKLVADKGQVARGFGFAAIVIRSDLADTVPRLQGFEGPQVRRHGQGRLQHHPARKSARARRDRAE